MKDDSTPCLLIGLGGSGGKIKLNVEEILKNRKRGSLPFIINETEEKGSFEESEDGE